MARSSRLSRLIARVEAAEDALSRRIGERLDPFFNVLSEMDLEEIARQTAHGGEIVAMIDEYIATGRHPSELRQELYPDVPQAVITPAVVQPQAQPLPIETTPEARQAPAIEPMPAIQAPVMAGLVRAKFIGKLAPGSTSVPTTEGLKPLNPGEVYTFETAIFNRVKSMWPGWWEQV